MTENKIDQKTYFLPFDKDNKLTIDKTLSLQLHIYIYIHLLRSNGKNTSYEKKNIDKSAYSQLKTRRLRCCILITSITTLCDLRFLIVCHFRGANKSTLKCSSLICTNQLHVNLHFGYID